MQVSLQEIYSFVGYIGFGLAVLFAILAVVYFLRADVRGVFADLSGKTRQAGIADYKATPNREHSMRGALAQDGGWQGEILQGSLDEASSDALSGGQTGSDSSGAPVADQADQAEQAVARVQPGPLRQPEAGQGALRGQAMPAAFALVRSCVVVHSASIVAAGGGEAPFELGSDVLKG